MRVYMYVEPTLLLCMWICGRSTWSVESTWLARLSSDRAAPAKYLTYMYTCGLLYDAGSLVLLSTPWSTRTGSSTVLVWEHDTKSTCVLVVDHVAT